MTPNLWQLQKKPSPTWKGPHFSSSSPFQAPSPCQDQERGSVYIILLQLIIEIISGSNLIRHDMTLNILTIYLKPTHEGPNTQANFSNTWFPPSLSSATRKDAHGFPQPDLPVVLASQYRDGSHPGAPESLRAMQRSHGSILMNPLTLLAVCMSHICHCINLCGGRVSRYLFSDVLRGLCSDLYTYTEGKWLQNISSQN